MRTCVEVFVQAQGTPFEEAGTRVERVGVHLNALDACHGQFQRVRVAVGCFIAAFINDEDLVVCECRTRIEGNEILCAVIVRNLKYLLRQWCWLASRSLDQHNQDK